MFKLLPVVQAGDHVHGNLFKGDEHLGGLGKDESGLYINLRRQLAIQEMLDLLKWVNGLKEDFYLLKVEIKYVK